LKNRLMWAIAAASFVAIFGLDLPFPLIVATAALAGYIGGRIAPDKFMPGGGHGSAVQSFGRALIDDDTPTPEHARFTWVRLLKVVLVGALLWLVPMGMLTALYGWDSTLSQMGWFFTKAAVLTFGGAYAVLPYVYQGAVENFGWLTPLQMIDGLALGETTPGPLIMVVTFVGFVGGYGSEVLRTAFGPDSQFLAGAVAAIVVTWFTFLPSFVLIMAGAPFIETTHNDLKFTAPLSAITAAVVGVILNLALFFAYHVLWPQGFAGSVDWPSVLIAVAAAIALLRYKLNVIPVIAGCALLGLAIH
nr:chromate transporter [Rhodocyclaceae bacterium]